MLNEIRLVNKQGAALWLVTIAGLTTLIVLLTIAISDGAVPSQDRTVLDWVVDRDYPLVEGSTEFISALTSGEVAAALSVVRIVFLWLLEMTRAALAFAFVGVVIAVVVSGADFTIGEIAGRSRPLDASTDTSYPNGHVFASTVLFGVAAFLAVCYGLKKEILIPFLIILLGLAMALDFARIFRQAHWPSDVAAGYLLGALWAQVFATSIVYARGVSWLSSPKQASELAALEFASDSGQWAYFHRRKILLPGAERYESPYLWSR